MRVTSLLLASASPARAATLRSAGIEPIIHVADVDEHALLETAQADGPLPVSRSVQILAEAKARAVARAHPGVADVVLGCDSMLELDGEGLGKPHTPEVARQRWLRMRGRTGILHTGHFIIDRDGRTAEACASTEVSFANITDAEIEAYIATGEPLKVAGAFTIDSLGGAFISGIKGDHHAVVGLSLPSLRLLLSDLGYSWPSLWHDQP